MNLSDFTVDMRVQTTHNTSLGAQEYGRVEVVGRKWLHVRMERTGHLRKYLPAGVTPVPIPEVKPGSTTIRTHYAKPEPNARQRRLMRNGAQRYRVTLPSGPGWML